MSEFSRAALFCTTLVLLAGAAVAQVDDSKVFNLSTSETAKAEVDSAIVVEHYEPRIEPGKFEASVTIGYLGLTKTLLQHDQMIYKATSEAFSYGNVTLKGGSAFTPFLHLGYNVNEFLAVEAHVGMSFSEYTATIDNAHLINPEDNRPVPPAPIVSIGEFDAEYRSLLGIFTNVNAVLYPLSFRNEGKGRWHPYLTAGVGRAQYDMDSNYTDNAASAFNSSFGGGVRLIADDLISLRFEVLQMFHDIEFTPAEYFDIRDEGTVRVPLYEFAPSGRYTPIESFESQRLGSLAWSLGITASF
jgi:hypothetical protein